MASTDMVSGVRVRLNAVVASCRPCYNNRTTPVRYMGRNSGIVCQNGGLIPFPCACNARAVGNMAFRIRRSKDVVMGKATATSDACVMLRECSTSLVLPTNACALSNYPGNNKGDACCVRGCVSNICNSISNKRNRAFSLTRGGGPVVRICLEIFGNGAMRGLMFGPRVRQNGGGARCRGCGTYRVAAPYGLCRSSI